MKKHVAIVGSGVAGLACAIRLACAGHRVEVFEGNSYPGGKLSEFHTGAYRFDAGPSLFTLPHLVEDLFRLAGESPEAHFRYHRLDVSCHYFYPDGTFLRAFADQAQLAAEVTARLNEPAANLERAIQKSAYLYETLSDLFMYRSLQDPGTFFSKAALKAYTRLHRLGFFSSLNKANEQSFRDPRLVQLFNRYATYNGSSPYLTPATMHIIPHLEMSMGAFFPEGGMYAITQGLYALAQRLGVTFHFRSPVQEILVKNGAVTGLLVHNDKLPFDRVVSNADMVNTYRKLLPDLKPPKLLLRQPKSSSALIFYWGIRQKFDRLHLHNIFFSADYRKEFQHIFEERSIYHDPTVYVNISSKYAAADAPVDGENWFTMINVPNNSGQDWDGLIPQAREFVLQKLSHMLDTDVASLIEVEQLLEPRTIELRTSSAQGALYGNSSNNLFAAFLRHGNVSRRVKGLYFCGGSVHPGGGIPMSLSSAMLVARHFK